LYKGDTCIDETKRYIDYIVPNKSGDIIWVVLYKGRDYYLYIPQKIEGRYVLIGTHNSYDRYKKVKK